MTTNKPLLGGLVVPEFERFVHEYGLHGWTCQYIDAVYAILETKTIHFGRPGFALFVDGGDTHLIPPHEHAKYTEAIMSSDALRHISAAGGKYIVAVGDRWLTEDDDDFGRVAALSKDGWPPRLPALHTGPRPPEHTVEDVLRDMEASPLTPDLAEALLECPVSIRRLFQQIPGPGYWVGSRGHDGEIRWNRNESFPAGTTLIADAWFPEVLLHLTTKPAGELTFEEMRRACENMGINLLCGACAEQFYTGITLNEHECGATKNDPDPEAT